MQITRSKPDTTNISELSAMLNGINGPCVGCSECNGLCIDLIDALVVPEIVLGKGRKSS